MSGDAQIIGNVTAINGGQINPGNSPGKLSIDGGFALNGGVLVVELSGVAANQHDVLQVSGSTDLSAGTVRFEFEIRTDDDGNLVFAALTDAVDELFTNGFE